MQRTARRHRAFLAICAFIILTAVDQAQGDVLKVYYDGVDRETITLQTIDAGSIHYVSVGSLADALDVRTYYSNKAKKAVLYFGAHEVKVTAFNSFVMIGTDLHQLPVEVLYYRGEILVPLRFFLEIVKGVYSGELRLDLDMGVLTVFPHAANIIGLTVDQKANGTLIRINTTRPFDASDIYTSYSDSWLYVDVYGGKVDTLMNIFPGQNDVVREVHTRQLSPDAARVALKLKGSVVKPQEYVPENASEIQILLRTKDVISAYILEELRYEREKWHIDTIVIDPGHGGHDPGAIGPTGLYEKDVTLAVSKELKRLITDKLGAKVYMTREADKFLKLKERTSFANQHDGKLFISIHANSNLSRHVRGFMSFFLGPAKTEEAQEVARLENSVIKEYEKSSNDYVDFENESFILAAMAQNSFNKESQDLAAMISNAMDEKLDMKNRGIDQDYFYVLIGASMPNVLIEIGFISNRDEEKLLRSPAYQKKIAEAIFEGIRKFKDKYESLI